MKVMVCFFTVFFTKAVFADSGRDLASACVTCHNGKSDLLVDFAGMPKAQIEAMLNVYRQNEKQGTIMPQILRAYTPPQQAKIAAWFSAQPTHKRVSQP